MNNFLVKLVAMSLAGASPDGGVPASFLGAHDGDSLTVGFACTGPVTVTATVEGLSMVQAPANAPPLTMTIPCRNGFVSMPYRIAGIDTPEMSSTCQTASQRVAERELALKAKQAVTEWLSSAQSITLHDMDMFGEKWGRTLGRLEYTDKPGDSGWMGWISDMPSHDLGAKLILGGYARAYSGGTKTPFCND